MKRRNDLYITENMLQASLQGRQKTSVPWKLYGLFGFLLLAALGAYMAGFRPF